MLPCMEVEAEAEAEAEAEERRNGGIASQRH